MSDEIWMVGYNTHYSGYQALCLTRKRATGCYLTPQAAQRAAERQEWAQQLWDEVLRRIDLGSPIFFSPAFQSLTVERENESIDASDKTI